MFIKMFGKILLRRPLTPIWKQNIKRVIFFLSLFTGYWCKNYIWLFQQINKNYVRGNYFLFINFVQRFSTSKILYFPHFVKFSVHSLLPSGYLTAQSWSPYGSHHGLRHSKNYSAFCMRISCQKNLCEAPLPQKKVIYMANSLY